MPKSRNKRKRGKQKGKRKKRHFSQKLTVKTMREIEVATFAALLASSQS